MPITQTYSTDKILQDLKKSGCLGKSKRQRALVQYLLEVKIKGRADDIRESDIAMDVLGRPSSFNSTEDSIVRVEMHRLRKNLSLYNTQAPDGYKIKLPKGSYELEIIPLKPPSNETPADSPPQRRFSRLRLAMISIEALALIGLIYLFIPKALQTTYRIRFSFDLPASDYDMQSHQVMAAFFQSSAKLNEDSPLHILSTQNDNSDYILSLAPAPASKTSDNRWSLFAKTRSGTLIWTKTYDLQAETSLDKGAELAQLANPDIFFSTGTIQAYHLTNPDINHRRLKLYNCMGYSLSYTLEDYTGPDVKNILSCLNANATRLTEDKSYIHTARADILSQAARGNIELNIPMPLEKARYEITQANKLPQKKLFYYIVALRIDLMSDPIPMSDVRKKMSAMIDQYPDQPNTKYVAAFINGFYWNNWEAALNYADEFLADHPERPATIQSIYETQYLLQGDYKKAYEKSTLIPPQNSLFMLIRNTIVNCYAGYDDQNAGYLSQALEDKGIREPEAFIMAVKKQNLHPEIEKLYTQKDKLKLCKVFNNA